MDLFLLNGDADDLSLQDMIEKDMKSEFGMSTFDEFSSEFSLSAFDSDVCMKNLEPLFDSLPGMDLDSPCTAATPAASSTHSSCSSSSSLEDEQGRLAMERSIHDISWLSASASHRDLAFDIDTAIMVNPSSVLPSILPSRSHQICVSSSSSSSASSVSPLLSSPSPLLSSSPVLLSSASLNNSAQAAVFSSADPGITNYHTTTSSAGVSSTQTVYIKTEALHNSMSNPSTVQISHGANTQVTVLRPVSSNSNLVTCNSSSATALAPAIIATSRHLTPQQQSGKLVSQHRLQISSNSSISPSNLRQQHTVVAQSTGRLGQHNTQIVTHQPITAVPTSCNNGQIFRGKPALVRNANLRRNEEKVLPKPAYSYSCLIALALKNSSSGSLPVSEIYSFMCEYFPYFRTAPNGWKNSVRHNLSLNKCFEKIEKPVVSGNNQRKGCLWALNPNKVHKMDEEIQKWSKKDLQGIRDAMNTPDVLGALERGEMKFEATSSTSSCSEDEDEDEEVDALTLTEPPPPTLATLKFVGSSESRVGAGGQHRGATTGVTVLQGGKTVGQQTTILRANSGSGQQHHQLISAKMRPGTVFTGAITSSPARSEPEYILPDSTMTEISFQANGALLDDLGNEISLEEDLSSASVVSTSSSNCIPTSAAVGVVSSPRSLVLRKLPLTAVRSPTLRANYVYSPALTSPHQHHGLNRLVLTNAKMA